MFSAATKEAANDTLAEAKVTAANAKRDIRDTVNSKKDRTGNELVAYAERAGREVRHLIDNAADQLDHAGERLSGEIRNHPLRSGAIALGVGVLLGALLRR